jgi:hypothetical protein
VNNQAQRPLFDKTEQSKETNVHHSGGIRTQQSQQNHFSYCLKFGAYKRNSTTVLMMMMMTTMMMMKE